MFLSCALHAAVLFGIAGISLHKENNLKNQTVDVELNLKKAKEIPDIHIRGEKDKFKENKSNESQISDEGLKGGLSREGIDDENSLAYRSLVLRKLQENRKYPPFARRKGIEGVARVGFHINKEGLAEDIMLIKSTGQKVLDDEVFSMIKRASPFPKPESKILMDVEIIFKLN